MCDMYTTYIKISCQTSCHICRNLTSVSPGEGTWPVIRHVRRDKSTAEGRHASQAVESSGSGPCSHQDEVGIQCSRRRREWWKRIEPTPTANWITFKNSPLVKQRDATRRDDWRTMSRIINRRLRSICTREYEGNARCALYVSRAREIRYEAPRRGFATYVAS